MDFRGEKFSSHSSPKDGVSDNKEQASKKYNLTLVNGAPGSGFSVDQSIIHYGDNAGHQALNLAILFGSPYIVLVGYDMRVVDNKKHFFGDHPQGLFNRNEYESFARHFKEAPEGVTIVNATPGSALSTYPIMDLGKAILLSHEYILVS